MGGRSTQVSQHRLPYLDGLRAVAVSMVLAYHGGLPGLRTGGFYGVDVFFVLSGFLITSLLLRQEHGPGGIRFGAFWARRARRLLPALLLMLAAADLYVAFVAPPGRYPGFRRDALSAVFYVSNWHFIAASSNYFAASSPSLLIHTWSLAIEEQFYLVWPAAVWVSATVARRLLRVRPATAVLAVAGTGALVSAGWMAIGYRTGQPATSLYFGTGTHASSILVGAALGAALARTGRLGAGGAGMARAGRAAAAATGTAGLALAGVGWAACSIGSDNAWAYQGGFLGVAAATAVLLAALSLHPAGMVPRALSVRPVAYIGRISYGMYLWYFPLFAVIDHSATGISGPGLLALRAAADAALAAASYHLVERRFLREPVSGTASNLGSRPRRPVVVTAAGVAAVAVLLSFTAPPGGLDPGSASEALAQVQSGNPPDRKTAPVTDRTGVAPLRLLVTGDSSALTLGLALGFPAVEHRYGLVVDDAALMGCGLVVSSEIADHGHRGPPPAACAASTPPGDQWPALLRSAISAFRPDVVLIAAGRWELDARRPQPGAPWTDITRPDDRAYVRGQLELAASIARAGGAQAALATAPCFDSGEAPDGTGWPADSRSRLRIYNDLVRSVAAAQPGTGLVDLNAAVCPGGRFETAVGGVTVRAPDGIHYPFFNIAAPLASDPDTESQVRAFGLWIASRVVPGLGAPAA